MKQLIYFLLVCFIFLVSCNKDDKVSSELPAWLQDEIRAMQQATDVKINFCEICDVEIYSFESQKYYSLYCGHWSCMNCYVYGENQELVDWTQEEWEIFSNNKQLIKTVPMCVD